MLHGTRSKYTHGGCRCEECTAAHAAYYCARRAALRGETWMRGMMAVKVNEPQDLVPEHGTELRYRMNWCVLAWDRPSRCDRCRQAHHEWLIRQIERIPRS